MGWENEKLTKKVRKQREELRERIWKTLFPFNACPWLNPLRIRRGAAERLEPPPRARSHLTLAVPPPSTGRFGSLPCFAVEDSTTSTTDLRAHPDVIVCGSRA
eukprot:scaffold7206_cov57-Phaeocystis_antarctica.AAC.9